MIQRPNAANGRSVGYTATSIQYWFPCGLVIGSPEIIVNITNMAEKCLSDASTRHPHPSSGPQPLQAAKSVVGFANHRLHDLRVQLDGNNDRALFDAIPAARHDGYLLTLVRQRHAICELTVLA